MPDSNERKPRVVLGESGTEYFSIRVPDSLLGERDVLVTLEEYDAQFGDTGGGAIEAEEK